MGVSPKWGNNSFIAPNATIVGNNVSIGHNAIVHGCTIHDNVLIGMGAIVMDNVVIGENFYLHATKSSFAVCSVL